MNLGWQSQRSTKVLEVEIYVVREISIHDDHKIASHEFQPMHVGGAESKFPGASAELDMFGAVRGDQLLRDFLRAVGGGIVDDNKLPVELSV